MEFEIVGSVSGVGVLLVVLAVVLIIWMCRKGKPLWKTNEGHSSARVTSFRHIYTNESSALTTEDVTIHQHHETMAEESFYELSSTASVCHANTLASDNLKLSDQEYVIVKTPAEYCETNHYMTPINTVQLSVYSTECVGALSSKPEISSQSDSFSTSLTQLESVNSVANSLFDIHSSLNSNLHSTEADFSEIYDVPNSIGVFSNALVKSPTEPQNKPCLHLRLEGKDNSSQKYNQSKVGPILNEVQEESDIYVIPRSYEVSTDCFSSTQNNPSLQCGFETIVEKSIHSEDGLSKNKAVDKFDTYVIPRSNEVPTKNQNKPILQYGFETIVAKKVHSEDGMSINRTGDNSDTYAIPRSTEQIRDASLNEQSRQAPEIKLHGCNNKTLQTEASRSILYDNSETNSIHGTELFVETCTSKMSANTVPGVCSTEASDGIMQCNSSTTDLSPEKIVESNAHMQFKDSTLSDVNVVFKRCEVPTNSSIDIRKEGKFPSGTVLNELEDKSDLLNHDYVNVNLIRLSMQYNDIPASIAVDNFTVTSKVEEGIIVPESGFLDSSSTFSTTHDSLEDVYDYPPSSFVMLT